MSGATITEIGAFMTTLRPSLANLGPRSLGHSGLQVSPLCLGAMTFGEADASSFMHGASCTDTVAHAMLSRALDAGINFVDTADVYGQDGLSERVIGEWFAATGRRDEVVLATKFRFRMGPGPLGTGASRRRVMAACEASLRRLRTDRIDLYQMHMQDIDTPIEETLRALDDLVRQGKVLYTGVSNIAAWRLADAMWTSKVGGLERFISLQVEYSLMERAIEREHVPLSRQFGLGIIPWSPLAGGFLSGKYRKGQPPADGSRLSTDRWKQRMAAVDSPRGWRVLAAVDAVAAEVGATPAQVSLAWLLHKPQVSSVLFGARTLEQLDDNLRAASLALSPEQVAALDKGAEFDPGYPYSMIARIQQRW